MSKSYGNAIPMFATPKQVKKAVMGIVTDSTPVEEPKDTSAAVFQLWSLFATAEEKEAYFAKAKAGGLGYGDVKKDLLARVKDVFDPMRERREELAGKPDTLEEILADGGRRARAIAEPVLEACRAAAGLGAAKS